MFSALPLAQDTKDGANLAAGVAPVHEAAPAIADPDPGHTPDPSPTPPGTRSPNPSPSLAPNRDPGPGQSLSLSLSLGPEVGPQHPKEDPGLDLKASPNQRKMEVNLRRALHISKK